MTAAVFGSLPSFWENQLEFLAPGLMGPGAACRRHLGSEPVDRKICVCVPRSVSLDLK